MLARRINALMPWPGSSVEVDGLPLKAGLADAIDGEGAAPGTVLGADDAGLRIATGAGVLRLRKLQRPGGKMLPAPEFLRGTKVPTGAVLPSHPMPPLVAPRPFPRV
jgi:methionyl-tRNA formyltransferase